MSESRILTADELLAMSPRDRAKAVREGIVTDPEAVSADLLARARKKVDARIARQEGDEVTID